MDGIVSVVETTLSREQTNKIYGVEQVGACPWCGGTNRFHVYAQANFVPGIGYLGWFDCMDSSKGRAGCGRKGDMIDYIEMRRNRTYWEACAEVGIDGRELLNYRRATRGLQPIVQQCGPEITVSLSEKDDDDGKMWRKNAVDLARYASGQFTDESLSYLHGRGITSSTIKRHLLGFYPEYKVVQGKFWGAGKGYMRIPRGIVIPWFNDAHEIIALRFRRLPADESDQARAFYGVNKKTGEIERYRVLYGSSSHHLYGGDCLLPGCDVALFEGEFDALIAEQETDSCVCVATGSTGWARNSMMLRKLQQCGTVLVCFDTDANGAGEKASEYWLQRLNNAKRWRPLWKDASEMYSDGIHIDGWLSIGLDEIPEDQTRGGEYESEKPEGSLMEVEVQAEGITENDLPTTCIVCGREVECFSESGIPYCSEHLSVQQTAPPPVPVVHQALTREELADYAQTLARSSIPGRCAITIEPRCTLAEHVERLNALKREEYRQRATLPKYRQSRSA